MLGHVNPRHGTIQLGEDSEDSEDSEDARASGDTFRRTLQGSLTQTFPRAPNRRAVPSFPKTPSCVFLSSCWGGARSARCSLLLSMALTFCSLSPLICALGLVSFGLCRLTYGAFGGVWRRERERERESSWFSQEASAKGLYAFVRIVASLFCESSAR